MPRTKGLRCAVGSSSPSWIPTTNTNPTICKAGGILEQDPGIEFLHGGVRIVGDPCVPDRNDTSRQIHLSECVIGGTFFIRRDAMHALGGFREIAFACDAELFDRAVAAGLSIVKTTDSRELRLPP